MTREALQAFIETLTLQPRGSVQPDTPLLSSGMLDSTALLELIGFIEQRARVKVRPGDMTLANFDTITRMTAFLRQAASSAS